MTKPSEDQIFWNADLPKKVLELMQESAGSGVSFMVLPKKTDGHIEISFDFPEDRLGWYENVTIIVSTNPQMSTQEQSMVWTDLNHYMGQVKENNQKKEEMHNLCVAAKAKVSPEEWNAVEESFKLRMKNKG